MTGEVATRFPSTARAGWWSGPRADVAVGVDALADAVRRVGDPLYLLSPDDAGRPRCARIGRAVLGDAAPVEEDPPIEEDPPVEQDSSAGVVEPLMAYAGPLRPEALGDAAFRAAHGVKYAYVAGAMANGIASEALVEAMARAGMLAFFGSAGLEPARVERAIDRLQADLGELPFGFNLIHSPNEPDLEATVVDLYLRRQVRCVSASAYLGLTLPLVRYRLTGLHRDATGRVVARNRVVAKVSRVEVARKFLSPPPAEMVAALVAAGAVSAEEARLAGEIPMADDLTAEADSGGHTDNRPALALLPTLLALRDTLAAEYGFSEIPRVGAAGGIATPAAVAAAFAMGAAYVLTGTINQACREAGTSDRVRQMLAEASQADVMMAPAADMFEMGVNVQVLKRGTMFAMRARKLYGLYRAYDSMDALPAADRLALERDYFRCTLEEAWAQTRAFFAERDPRQIARAERDPKHRLALVFRKYLGQSSNWANQGEPTRQADYQVWCGPAMGAFNEWTRDTFLAEAEGRDVVTVARNLLIGAAALTRANMLRAQGVRLDARVTRFRPHTLDELALLVSSESGPAQSTGPEQVVGHRGMVGA
jgi:trans-AT polyketide synthase/acyltransferase/oxidoreductase domain-containing protein